MKQTQQIGDHTGDKVSISTLFCLREHFFLIHLSCRYQKWPNLTCQEPSSKLEEENFTQNCPPPPPRRVSEHARVFQPTATHSTHCVPKRLSFFVHYAPKRIMFSAHCAPKRLLFSAHFAHCVPTAPLSEL
jgi:hypothetical protein